MANDVVGLMDVLELESAHIAGMSMGGMIVQQVALQSPGRVRSLISIMSSTGEGGLPRATPEAQAALMETAPHERTAYLEYSVRTQRCFAGDGFPFDEAGWRELAGRAFDRAFDPAGIARQFASIATSDSRHEALASLALPSLVLHGGNDPLIPPEAGVATARTIPDAELRIVEGMGHNLPRGAWPELISAISAHTEKAEKH
jgi:pimeloyl-ACP methyl ester carboxylesterase